MRRFRSTKPRYDFAIEYFDADDSVDMTNLDSQRNISILTKAGGMGLLDEVRNIHSLCTKEKQQSRRNENRINRDMSGAQWMTQESH